MALNHYALTYGSRLLVTAVGFAVSIVSARALGAEGRGELALAVTATGVVVQLTNLGLSSALIYAVSRRARRTGPALGLAYTVAGALLIASGVVALALRSTERFWPVAGLVALWAPVQLLTVLQDQVLLGTRRIPLYTSLQVVARAATLAAALGVAWTGGGPLMFAASQLAIEAGAALVGTVALARQGLRPSRWSWRWLRPVRAVAFRAMPPLLFGFLLVRSDILIVGWFHATAIVGPYALAAQLVDLLLIFPSTIGVVLFPRLAASGDPARDTARLARAVGLALAAVAIVMAGTGWFVIPIVFGEAFGPAFQSLITLLPGAVALGYESVLTQYFSHQGFPTFLSRYWAGVFGLNVAVNLVLVPSLGAFGAALTSSVAYTTLCMLVTWRFVRATQLPWSALWSDEALSGTTPHE